MSNGSGYDPLAYGQVRLAQSSQPASGGSGTPEDMLFDAGKTPFAPPTGTDQEWGMDAGPTFVPGAGTIADLDLAGDILGAAAPAPAAASAAAPAAAPSQRARPAPAPSPAPQPAATAPRGTSTPTSPRPTVAAATPAAASAQPASGTPATPRPAPRPPAIRPVSAAPMAAPRRPASVLLPSLVFTAGAGGAAWLWFGMHNPVLAGVAAGLAVVGSLFTWFWSAR